MLFTFCKEILADAGSTSQGDIARYGMEIKKDREMWRKISRTWYTKLAAYHPDNGRPYYHLAALIEVPSYKQLSLFARSFTCTTPAEVTNKCIIISLNDIEGKKHETAWMEVFVNLHAVLLERKSRKQSNVVFDTLIGALTQDSYFNKHVTKASTKLSQSGVFTAIFAIAALFEYGAPKARLRIAYEHAQGTKNAVAKSQTGILRKIRNTLAFENNTGSDSDVALLMKNQAPTFLVLGSASLAGKVLKIWLSCQSEKAYPLIHIYLVFIWSLIVAQKHWKAFENDVGWRSIERSLPWYSICQFLNFLKSEGHSPEVFANDFPRSNEKSRGDTLPEDPVFRGQIYSQWYFPSTWFTDSMVEDDEGVLEMPSTEMPSTTRARMERIMWLGHRIALVCRIFAGSNINTD